MRDFRDAKAMAQTLRESLKSKSVSLTHSECLELVATTLGFHDWNVLAAKIQSSQPSAAGSRSSQAAGARSTPDVIGIPVIPMRDVVFFPQMVTPIFIAREKSWRAADHALAKDGILLVVTQKNASDDGPGFESLYRVGVTASVINRIMLPDGTLKLFVSCLERKVVGHSTDGDFLAAEALPFVESRDDSKEAAELSRAVIEAYRIYADLPEGPKGLFRLPGVGAAGLVADSIAPFLVVGIDKRQQILETSDVVTRLETILDIMKNSQQAA